MTRKEREDEKNETNIAEHVMTSLIKYLGGRFSRRDFDIALYFYNLGLKETKDDEEERENV